MKSHAAHFPHHVSTPTYFLAQIKVRAFSCRLALTQRRHIHTSTHAHDRFGYGNSKRAFLGALVVHDV